MHRHKADKGRQTGNVMQTTQARAKTQNININNNNNKKRNVQKAEMHSNRTGAGTRR